MKKIVSLLMLLSTSFLITSCSKEDDGQSNNPLKGTIWSFEDEVTVINPNYFTRYIEFVDQNTVQVWDTDNNGRIYTGTYTVNGNKVLFHNLHDTYWDWYYVDGTFSSKSLTISYSYNGQNSGPTAVRRNFTIKQVARQNPPPEH